MPPNPDTVHNQPRVYAFRHDELTPEQLATTFAMASRRPDPFDQTAQAVSATRAQDFHQRWYVGYGHASIAEHAVIHLAVENISRLAADILLDHRLGSYTEQSSRYQPLDAGRWRRPTELTGHLADRYGAVCRRLFDTYREVAAELPAVRGRPDYDSARALLPAATLTNVGLTANARVLAHLIAKLRSHPLSEVRNLGERTQQAAVGITPTLLRHADPAERHTRPYAATVRPYPQRTTGYPDVLLINASPATDGEAVKAVGAALLMRQTGDYGQASHTLKAMTPEGFTELLEQAYPSADPYAPAPRAFELVNYTFLLHMDYGALREYRRHRMQTVIGNSLAADLGFHTPAAFRHLSAGTRIAAEAAIRAAETAYRVIGQECPDAAGYLATHGHRQQQLAHLNLRELHHIARLRTSPQAHPSVNRPVAAMCQMAKLTHPRLTRRLP